MKTIKNEWKKMGEDAKKLYKEYSKKDQFRYKLTKEPKRVIKQGRKENMRDSTYAELEDQLTPQCGRNRKR
jgi:hypothetical protein